MARPLRVQEAGLTYHVMSRGNAKMKIFVDDLDYARFLEIYAEAVDRYELDGLVMCLMPNHSHLVFRTRLANLSTAMHFVNGKYTQWWNRRHRRVGHVLQGRFKGQIVETGVYLRRLCGYVLRNPLRANLVAHPSQWPWSSYSALARNESTATTRLDALARALDPDMAPSCVALLLDSVDPDGEAEMADFVRNDRRIIGTDAFATRFRARAMKASREVPLRERRIGSPSLPMLLAESIQRGERLDGGVRTAAAAGHSLTEIAQCAGLSPRTVAKLVNRRCAAVN